MRVDVGRQKRVVKAIDDASVTEKRYTFENFCKERELYRDGFRERLNDVFIVCPFHDDSNPSLVFNENTRRWKCFGCGAGGNFIDLLVQFEREVLGIDINFSKKVNELLHKDREMQARLGFNTIFRVTKRPEDLEIISFSRFHITTSRPGNYLELASILKKNGVSREDMKFAVSLMQSGIAPGIILEQIMKKPVSKEKKYSVQELEGEE